MRTTLFTLCPLLSAGLSAQCPFTPAISPMDPILCPGETIALQCTPHESYQWYRNGQAIPGAVGQSLAVDYFSGSGFQYSVAATEDNCTEMSAQVLVDGWVFLPPFVITDGDEPISIGPDGTPLYCVGANVQLTLGMPYTENVQWTVDGIDIPGANSPTLVVTQPGSYSVSGAPALCPGSVTPLGLQIDIAFMDTIQPVITALENELCAFPAGQYHQWYLNGTAFQGSTAPCLNAMQPGVYTVYVDYGHGCQTMSAPFFSTGIGAAQAFKPWRLYPSPSTGYVVIDWEAAREPGVFWTVQDAAGRTVRDGFMPLTGPLLMDLSDLPRGTYLFQAAYHGRALGGATRFTLVR